MPLRGFRLMVVIGVMLLLTGLVLPVVASAIDSYERDRAEAERSSVECTPELFDEDELDGDGPVRVGTGTFDTECLDERNEAREEATRERVLTPASMLDVTGWAFRIGGVFWIVVAIRARWLSRV